MENKFHVDRYFYIWGINMNSSRTVIFFSLSLFVSFYGVAQESITYAYQLRAEDGTFVKTNAPLHEISPYIKGALEPCWKGRNYEQNDDSKLIDVPLKTGAPLMSLIKLCEYSNQASNKPLMSYIESNNAEDRAKIAYLSGFFGFKKVDQALVEYFKDNPQETVILNIHGKENWSAEQRSGLGHLSQLLADERCFTRPLKILFGEAKVDSIDLCFYTWNTTQDVYEAIAASSGIDFEELKKMVGVSRVGSCMRRFAYTGVSREHCLAEQRLNDGGVETSIVFWPLSK